MHDILDTNGLFHGFNTYILYSVNLLFFLSEWLEPFLGMKLPLLPKIKMTGYMGYKTEKMYMS